MSIPGWLSQMFSETQFHGQGLDFVRCDTEDKPDGTQGYTFVYRHRSGVELKIYAKPATAFVSASVVKDDGGFFTIDEYARQVAGRELPSVDRSKPEQAIRMHREFIKSFVESELAGVLAGDEWPDVTRDYQGHR